MSPADAGAAAVVARSETRDGMAIDWDVAVRMDDGVELRADVFRPLGEGRFPVLITYGPYGKGLALQEGYPDAWRKMVADHPDVAAGSSNLYQNWEVADPEKWVPDGYACVRVDSRGSGRSPGYIDPYSPRETRDFHDCIEWTAAQPWSSGKVGVNGVSYYAVNQWNLAASQPEHLAAICVWEGAADFYRDSTHHGGIRNTFLGAWYAMQVESVQFGSAPQGRRHPVTGEPVCGPLALPPEALARNRCDLAAEIAARPLDGPFYRERSAAWDRVVTPLLSAANWAGQGLHGRGNFEGFVNAASRHKWLEVHGLEHWTHFYTDYGVDLQKRFFGHFLKGEANGWAERPPVQLQVRRLDRFVERFETEWPIARTSWTPLNLHPDATLRPEAAPSGEVTFDAMGDGVTFLAAPFAEETEITGPSALSLVVSSSTADADLFVVLRLFAPDLKEVVFAGAVDPHTPIGQGWLRASRRKLDPARSLPWRPYHAHDEVQPLPPGEPVAVEVEIWPTCVVAPAGYRLGVTVRGRDYEYGGDDAPRLSNFRNALRGCGPFLHDDPQDRPPEVFAGRTRLHFGPGCEARLLLPVIPPREDAALVKDTP